MLKMRSGHGARAEARASEQLRQARFATVGQTERCCEYLHRAIRVVKIRAGFVVPLLDPPFKNELPPGARLVFITLFQTCISIYAYKAPGLSAGLCAALLLYKISRILSIFA